MRTVLGIDAGGTYTDSVVIDADTDALLHKGKTFTTKDDLTRCLTESFAALPEALLGNLAMVCLSSTLATNCVVEGRGAREGLVLVGDVPRGELPTSRRVLVKGRHDLKGRLVENIDAAEVEAAVESLRGTVDAVAVSGYASVRCPDHELYVKAVAEDRLGVPVVCAHELTSRLGFSERTVTTVLNARLIPIVCDLMDAVKHVMTGYGVQAPLMMVRGDGTLMAEGLARSKPIETVLSGPAASAIGGVHLSGRSDCLVMDIGGTTTDVAHVAGGRPTLRADGARVGDWTTHVRAAEVFTVGLGGDSRIRVDATGRLRIGPQRSTSWSVAATRHRHLVDELAAILDERAHRCFVHAGHEAYALAVTRSRPALSLEESRILETLRQAPHTLFHLERTLGLAGVPNMLDGLVRAGLVERVSLTPTDLWHVTGQYTAGDRDAPRLALQITADLLRTTPDELTVQLQNALTQQVQLAAARAAMYLDGQDPTVADGGPADYFLNRLSLRPDDAATLTATYRLRTPVVGVGAPASTWLHPAGSPHGASPGTSPGASPALAEATLFNAEVPEHAEVANAVGAAVAHAVESVDILIRQDTVSGLYLAFCPQGRLTGPTLHAATEAAVRSGEEFLARLTGRADLRVDAAVHDVRITSASGDRTRFVERVVALSGRIGG